MSITKLVKKVINEIAPVTLAECVYLGDGTTATVKDFIDSNKDGTNKYLGKSALWLGDSISVTGNPTYPKYVCDKLGMTLTNKASSGGNSTRMRHILQGGSSYTAIDCTNIDYMFIMIGHNDRQNTTQVSDIPTDTTSYVDYPETYCCNIASCIEYARNQNPNIKIFLITPLQTTNTACWSGVLPASTLMKEIGSMYSVPVIDVFGECGICRRNVDSLTDDGVHPNNTSVPIVGDYIVNYLENH